MADTPQMPSEATVPGLLLRSLEIHGFRGFRELVIDRLARVNLFVGKNNVGKTSVLEALWLYANPRSPWAVLDLLASRDAVDAKSISENAPMANIFPFQSLFYLENWADVSAVPLKAIQIGEKHQPQSNLTISLEHHPANQSPFAYSLQFTIAETKGSLFLFNVNGHESPTRSGELRMPLKPLVGWEHPSAFVRADGLGVNRTEIFWDSIALTEAEAEVILALRLIAPDVERLTLKPVSNASKDRVPFVKLMGNATPVPLRSLGDGMNRIFGIALALVNAKGGFLLVDEVENGLHYAIQPLLWQLIFQIAKRLNVQVFATTHSFDCIRAFDAAGRESPEDGILIRLAQKAGRVLVGEFDEQELAIAVEGQIEVR